MSINRIGKDILSQEESKGSDHNEEVEHGEWFSKRKVTVNA